MEARRDLRRPPRAAPKTSRGLWFANRYGYPPAQQSPYGGNSYGSYGGAYPGAYVRADREPQVDVADAAATERRWVCDVGAQRRELLERRLREVVPQRRCLALPVVGELREKCAERHRDRLVLLRGAAKIAVLRDGDVDRDVGIRRVAQLRNRPARPFNQTTGDFCWAPRVDGAIDEFMIISRQVTEEELQDGLRAGYKVTADWTDRYNNNIATHMYREDDAGLASCVVINDDAGTAGVNGDESANSPDYRGAVYLFSPIGMTWQQQDYVKASNPGQQDRFGWSVSLSVPARSVEDARAQVVRLRLTSSAL